MIQVVILAGGAGTRLKPFTNLIPKPMIPINDSPFILYLIEWLKRYNISKYVFCVGYLWDQFKEFFGNGKKIGVDIEYSIEKEFLGTAGAIKLAQNLLADDFMVINGDTYLPIDYNDVYNKYKESNKLGLMVVYDNSDNVAENNILLDENGLVSAYLKKEQLKKGDELDKIEAQKENKHFQYVDAGVYVFSKKILENVKEGLFFSLEKDIYPKLIEERQLQGYVTSQRYYDMGTPERLDLIRKVLK